MWLQCVGLGQTCLFGSVVSTRFGSGGLDDPNMFLSQLERMTFTLLAS